MQTECCCKTPGSLSFLEILWIKHMKLGLMQKARGIYCSCAPGSSQTQRRGSGPQHPTGEFLYGFQGQNRASATRHNMIGRTVCPLNWLVFREWGSRGLLSLSLLAYMLSDLSLPGGEGSSGILEIPNLWADLFIPPFSLCMFQSWSSCG